MDECKTLPRRRHLLGRRVDEYARPVFGGGAHEARGEVHHAVAPQVETESKFLKAVRHFLVHGLSYRRFQRGFDWGNLHHPTTLPIMEYSERLAFPIEPQNTAPVV